ncbi:MAG: hypothetical protein NVV73_04245 [Cellvibrionaceae bacterium]|nr:hypothetical protein [Cellvibrionaceae bacterium]
MAPHRYHSFDARHRHMATLHHYPQGEGVVLLKGAPEKVIALCRAQMDASGEEQPIVASSLAGSG